MRKQKGFSLIELLIVVAIILIIAAIAIPNLLRARMAANESAAASSIRTINTAMVSYITAYPTVGYAATLKALGGASPCTASSAQACLIDNNLAVPPAAGKSGYLYAATGLPATYEAGAWPVTTNSTGTKTFCSVEDAVVRVDTLGTAADPGAGCSALPGLAN
ncbi:MAG: prepilin-type N-terminal cleavage/methylation domain-containing protein [Candidatus Sulfotelmatobacter sp.]